MSIYDWGRTGAGSDLDGTMGGTVPSMGGYTRTISYPNGNPNFHPAGGAAAGGAAGAYVSPAAQQRNELIQKYGAQKGQYYFLNPKALKRDQATQATAAANDPTGITAALSGDTTAMAKALTDQWNKSNAENQARYDKLLEQANTYGAQSLAANQNAFNQSAGAFQGQANVLTGQNERMAQNQRGAGQQSLISRGLGNSTVVNTMQQGVNRNQMQQQQSISAQLAQQLAALRGTTLNNELDIRRNQTGMLNGIVEGRTDQGPDMSAWLNLLARPRATTGG